MIEEQQTPGSPAYHHYLTPAQFHAQFGPSAALVSAIGKELSAKGLHVIQVQTHSVTVSGTVGAVNAAFDTTLAAAHYPGGAQGMLALKPLKLTPNLQAAGAMIPAFEGVIHMHTFASEGRRHPQARSPIRSIASPQPGGYWFDDLKQAYAYPSFQKLTGAGVTIGILMTPNYNPPDMKLYFNHENLAVPKISTFNVEGGAPYDPNEAAETHIDITHSAGQAPKASVILYNMPDLADDSIFAALTDIVEINNVDVVNMSFGEPEVAYAPAYNGGRTTSGMIGLYDDFFAQGNALGITWVAASGDWAGKDIPPPACFEANAPDPCGAYQVGVGIPAASPHVTAVGGTNLVTTYSPPSLNSAYVAENANSDPLAFDIFFGTTATGAVWGSGGGISSYFAKPSYQNDGLAGLPAGEGGEVAHDSGRLRSRWAAARAEICTTRKTGSARRIVALTGRRSPASFYGYIGTSLSSPDFVGTLALKIQSSGGRLGNENYDIYSLAAAQENGSSNVVFRRKITGNNAVYKTYPGYNLVLGNGTRDRQRLRARTAAACGRHPADSPTNP